MDKAPDAFRTISEVADDLDIPQHVLRFWETRFTQIKPMKRSGGRRYYRPRHSGEEAELSQRLEGILKKRQEKWAREEGDKAARKKSGDRVIGSSGDREKK